MNLTKLALVVAVATVSAFSVASNAKAGEGGAAGSAAFTLQNDKVTGVAVSAAIGKQDAFAGAFNNGNQNAAFAMGSAGVINVNNITNTSVSSISSASDPALGTAQNNSFTTNTSVQIGSASPNKVVEIKPEQMPR